MILAPAKTATLRPVTSGGPNSWREFLPWRFWRRRARARQWAATLHSVEQDLAGFSGSVESVFLEAGERLMNLQLQAREISSQTTSVAGLLSNDGGSLAVLDAVLQTAGEDRQDHEIGESVEVVQKSSQAIRGALESFDRLVNTFDVLGMMTRIESARFETSGGTFVSLADAVMSLSRQIREHIGATADSALALLETASQAGEAVRRVAQIRRENLGPLARQTGVSIQEIAGRRRRAAQANTQLAARFEGVARAMGDLVEALQSHDIVRQQIEHALEALHRLDLLDRSDPSRFATARLQAAQLDNSRATFERSVGQARSALARIERNIEQVAGDAAYLLGPSDAANEASFVSGVESNLAGILKILESNADADRLLLDAVASIDQRVSEISRTIAGVQTIGVEMQRIALNATIQAARLGRDGGALEIVAHSVQGLAQEAGTSSATIEGRLGGIRDAAMALDKTAVRGDSATQIPQLHRSAAGLNSIQDRAQDGYIRTVGKIAELRRLIGETVSGFGDQSEVLERLAGAARLLHELAADGCAPGALDGERIGATYTMESERAVHHAVFDRNPPRNPASPLPDAAPGAIEGHEDNVEFF